METKVLDIAKIGDPVLRSKTKLIPIKKIKSFKVQNLINNMIATMHAVNGAGLAANQVFEPYRLCVLEVLESERYKHLEEIPLKILINPKITIKNKTSTFDSYEGCLSVPNLRGKVKRYSSISVEYYDREGLFIKEDVSGLNAIVYQHEIDHLDGFLFTDKVYNNNTLVTYENYLKYYQDQYHKELNNFINDFE